MTKTKTIEQEAKATLRTLEAKDPGLKQLLQKAYGYAVFPSIGKASLVIGGSYGKGAVFRYGEFIGYATIGQTTLGVQIGGDTFTEVIVFQNKPAFDRLKQGKLSFAADASAVLVKAGAAAARGFGQGTQAFVYGKGGMLLEAAIGGQKFRFKPAKEVEDESQEDQQQEGDQEDSGMLSRATGAARTAFSGVSEFVKGHPVAATAIGVGVAGGVAILVIRAMRSSNSQQEQGDESDQQMSQGDDDSDSEENRDADQGEESEEYASSNR